MSFLLLLFQDPIENIKLQLRSCLFSFLQFVAVPFSFLFFQDCDIFQDFWSSTLQNVSQIKLAWCLFIINLKLFIMGKSTSTVICMLFHTIRVYMMFISETTSDFKLDHLVHVVSARLLYCKVMMLCLVT